MRLVNVRRRGRQDPDIAAGSLRMPRMVLAPACFVCGSIHKFNLKIVTISGVITMNEQGAVLSAAAGHVVDLYRLFQFETKNPHSYSKFRQIKALGQRSGASVLIETGTYVGNTAMRCSRTFERVITIELDADLFQRASRYLSKRKNVECLEGDALKLLPLVLERPSVTDALVFLDGHFSGGGTAHGDLAEPACEEIEILAKYRDKIRSFIVDDFRCFGRDKGWPRRSELLRTVEDSFGDGFEYTIHLDQLLVWRKPSA
jgi:hypothetical protein